MDVVTVGASRRRVSKELTWSDLAAACDGLHHTQCPAESTRIYNHRWETFRKTYLTAGPSPLGNSTRVWWRHEDQVLLSAHAILNKFVLKVRPRGRLEALSTFMQPYGSILIRSRKVQSLEPHHEKRHASREHNAHGANLCCGCGSAPCPPCESSISVRQKWILVYALVFTGATPQMPS